jgi:hypothetical protein
MPPTPGPAIATSTVLLVLSTTAAVAAEASYTPPIPVLTPPTTIHVAVVADSLNGSLGLRLPPCAQQPQCSGNVSASCVRRKQLLVALASFGGTSLRQGSSQGLLLPGNTDQLRWLHRLVAVRPGLTLVTHPNATVWEVMAAMRAAQRAPLPPLHYVQYDVVKNRDSLAAARMATSRLNATMLDASIVVEAAAHGFRPAPPARVQGVHWSSDVRGMTAQRVLDEWVAVLAAAGTPPAMLGLEQFTNVEDPVQFQSDVAVREITSPPPPSSRESWNVVESSVVPIRGTRTTYLSHLAGRGGCCHATAVGLAPHFVGPRAPASHPSGAGAAGGGGGARGRVPAEHGSRRAAVRQLPQPWAAREHDGAQHEPAVQDADGLRGHQQRAPVRIISHGHHCGAAPAAHKSRRGAAGEQALC